MTQPQIASPQLDGTFDGAFDGTIASLDLATIEQFLRSELLSHSLDSARPNQKRSLEANYLTFNFPIELPHGHRSLFGLLSLASLVGTKPPVLDGRVSQWQERFYFRDRSSTNSSPRSTNVGIGASAVLLASGQQRFQDIQQQAQRLLSRVCVITHPLLADLTANSPSFEDRQPEALAPRLLGGFSFAPGSADHSPWHGQVGPRFGDARFILPRISLRSFDGARTGVLAVTLERFKGLTYEDETDLRELLQMLEQVVAVVASPPSATTQSPFRSPLQSPLRSELQQCPGTGAHFRARAASSVAQAVTQVERGAFEKVVVAQHRDLALAGPYQLSKLTNRVDQITEGGAAFALATGDAMFLGAPPERLVSVRNGRIETEAVAGSRPRGDRHDANDTDFDFHPDDKDRREHRSVVEHLSNALRPCCLGGVVECASPTVRAHPALLHLETPISGTMRPGLHILDLVARLHPTPAVCGAPTAFALAHLEATEEQPRGWYAAPIGWFDNVGNGEFAVALRSAVVRNGSARLFAGAGIVAGSEPASEAQEIARKMLPMARVLEPFLASSAESSKPLQWKSQSPKRGPKRGPKSTGTPESRWQRVLALVGLFG